MRAQKLNLVSTRCFFAFCFLHVFPVIDGSTHVLKSSLNFYRCSFRFKLTFCKHLFMSRVLMENQWCLSSLA